VAVKIIPALSSSENTRVKTQIIIGVSINAFVGILGARIVANTNRIGNPFDFDGFRANIFETDRAVFTAANAMVNKRSFINRTNRSAINVKIGMSRRRITRI
jgi:hypothetical protein